VRDELEYQNGKNAFQRYIAFYSVLKNFNHADGQKDRDQNGHDGADGLQYFAHKSAMNDHRLNPGAGWKRELIMSDSSNLWSFSRHLFARAVP